ncbi:MAG: hypothetical protein ACRC68_11960 [Clostridium sp.]
MNEYETENIKGYHVNDKERCLKFVGDRNYIIASEDTYWLGYGMYFWDNKGNANYWLKEKLRKESQKEHLMATCNINIGEDYLLDLADDEVSEMVEKLWGQYCLKKREKIAQPLGIKIDKLLKFFDELNSLKVIKAIGDYDINQTNKNYFFQKKGYKGPQVRSKLKIIYSVREAELIFNRELRGE